MGTENTTVDIEKDSTENMEGTKVETTDINVEETETEVTENLSEKETEVIENSEEIEQENTGREATNVEESEKTETTEQISELETTETEQAEVVEVDTEEISTETVVPATNITTLATDYAPYIFVGVGIALFLSALATAIILFMKKRKTLMVQETSGDENRTTLIKTPQISTGAASIVGARDNQQDSYCVCGGEKEALAVVADGMGGLANGAEISGIVTYVFKEDFDRLRNAQIPEAALMNMVSTANEQACSFIKTSGGEMSGSTVVAVYVKGDELYFIAVGDSRIYLMREGGLIQVNREHIYAYELDSMVINGLMSMENALNNRERKSLTSYIGMGELRLVDRNLEPIRLKAGDRVLIASDGVFGTLHSEEMISALLLDDAQSAVEALLDLVEEKAKVRQDNATAVVLFYE